MKTGQDTAVELANQARFSELGDKTQNALDQVDFWTIIHQSYQAEPQPEQQEI